MARALQSLKHPFGIALPHFRRRNGIPIQIRFPHEFLFATGLAEVARWMDDQITELKRFREVTVKKANAPSILYSEGYENKETENNGWEEI